MAKKKKGKRKGRGFQPVLKLAAQAAVAEWGPAESLAWEYGLALRKSEVKGRHRIGLHVMIDDAETGKRVLNYWPGNGTITSPLRPAEGKGKVETLQQAVETASKMVVRLAGKC